jgi:hypothetical protein
VVAVGRILRGAGIISCRKRSSHDLAFTLSATRQLRVRVFSAESTTATANAKAVRLSTTLGKCTRATRHFYFEWRKTCTYHPHSRPCSRRRKCTTISGVGGSFG